MENPTTSEQPVNLFEELNSNAEPMIMDSYCVNCEKQGKTTLLLTLIPFFREVVLVSFECEHCGFKNNEIQSGGKLQDQGLEVTFKVTDQEALSRDVAKSEYAIITIPELGFEIPAKKGQINTVEGFLREAIDGLNYDQEQRRLQDYADGKFLPFTFIVNDLSGNSTIKNPFITKSDPNLKFRHYIRTKEQNETLGFYQQQTEETVEEVKENEVNNVEQQTTKKYEGDAISQETSLKENGDQRIDAHRVDFTKPLEEDNVKGESLRFQIPCHTCGKMGEQSMCITSIPYFKELIIMSFLCDYCGWKSTETKVGGEISSKAQKITLNVETREDLNRELFKSETASVEIPEIGIELGEGTLGGLYTTVEGLLDKIQTNLKDGIPFAGDSMDSQFRKRIHELFKTLQECAENKKNFTLIIDDSLSNSFIQNPWYPTEDPRVKLEEYERTHEQNEDLGLNHIKTEGYETL